MVPHFIKFSRSHKCTPKLRVKYRNIRVKAVQMELTIKHFTTLHAHSTDTMQFCDVIMHYHIFFTI